jgi:transcriptional regulator with XRE-family HTH domain
MNIERSVKIGLAYQGWTQTRLADEMGVAQSNVSYWASRGTRLNMATVKRFADAFGYSVSEFIALGEEKAA